jgi:hypothetical protein
MRLSMRPRLPCRGILSVKNKNIEAKEHAFVTEHVFVAALADFENDSEPLEAPLSLFGFAKVGVNMPHIVGHGGTRNNIRECCWPTIVVQRK